MPLACILRGCKNIALPRHGEEVSVAFHRYELKTTQKRNTVSLVLIFLKIPKLYVQILFTEQDNNDNGFTRDK